MPSADLQDGLLWPPEKNFYGKHQTRVLFSFLNDNEACDEIATNLWTSQMPPSTC